MATPIRRGIIPLPIQPIPVPAGINPGPLVIASISPPSEIVWVPPVYEWHCPNVIVRDEGIHRGSIRPSGSGGPLTTCRDEDVWPFAGEDVLPSAPGAAVFAVARPDELRAAAA